MILTEMVRVSCHDSDLHFLVELRGFEPLTPLDANEVGPCGGPAHDQDCCIDS
jgi:hypothetical protein